MLRKLVVLVLVAGLSGLAVAQKDKPKDKDKPKKPPGTVAKVLVVDVDKKMLSVEIAGKRADFLVTKDTHFFGPKGGKRPEGLRDDVLKVGVEVRIVLDAAGKQLKEVHLPTRKGKKKDKDKKDDKKDKKDKK